MFRTIPSAPPDAILGLTATFRNDPRPDKINLSVGVYQDEEGKTPLLSCVHETEKRLAAAGTNKAYLPIPGAPEYAAAVQSLLFGAEHEAVLGGRVVTAHTPGGTGALRVAADFVQAHFPKATLWMSDPTWANHQGVFQAAGITTKSYPYFDPDSIDAQSGGLAIEKMLDFIGRIPAGDCILLHACCHNPTGVDPSSDQWQSIAEAVRKQDLLPLLDFAYQGFADGIDQDAQALRRFCTPGDELIVCSSFSKNFGLYRERVGALSVVCESAQVAESVLSQLKKTIRTNYSNPPAHGAAIVSTILDDSSLRAEWESEVGRMRARIHGMRGLLAEKLANRHICRPGGNDYSFITRQRGMFSYTGLTQGQVEMLRERFGIYMVGSGRINVAGITPSNIDRLADAIGEVSQ
jgi:aspartate/tyrosine/aromatic aminotransferase